MEKMEGLINKGFRRLDALPHYAFMLFNHVIITAIKTLLKLPLFMVTCSIIIAGTLFLLDPSINNLADLKLSILSEVVKNNQDIKTLLFEFGKSIYLTLFVLTLFIDLISYKQKNIRAEITKIIHQT